VQLCRPPAAYRWVLDCLRWGRGGRKVMVFGLSTTCELERAIYMAAALYSAVITVAQSETPPLQAAIDENGAAPMSQLTRPVAGGAGRCAHAR